MKRQQNLNYSKLKKLGNFSLKFAKFFGAKEDELIQRICMDLCEKRKYLKVNETRVYVCVDYCNECEAACKKLGLIVRTIYTKNSTKNYKPNHALNQVLYNGKWITFDPQLGSKCFEID